MIKHRLLSLVSAICLLLCAGSVFAQVNVQVQSRQNPLPAQGGVYMTDPGRFFNVVLTNTSSSEFLPVRLEVRLEGPIENGVDIWPNGDSFLATVASRTMPTYVPLQAGQTRVLTQTDLMNMFNQYDGGTEMYGGGALYDVFTGGANNGAFGLLPEGHYGLKITAKTNFTEYNDPGEFLGEGICYFDICYNAKAPSFNNIEYINNGNTYESGFVEHGGYYTAYFPTSNPRFSWTEPTFNATNLSVKRQFLYDFRIYQLAENQEPSDATLHNGLIAFEQRGLMTPQCFVPYNVVAQLKRYRNVKYVAQVTARTLVTDASNANYTIIENDGKSEMIVLLMEDSGISGGEETDIIVDTSNRDYPINVTISTKRTELPYAMYGYFETPGELFDITLENTSGEAIPVCMLLQYYKGNWGVTAAPNRQHTDKFIEIPAGEKITLSDEQVNELAGGYDIDYDVIAFKAKTGFIIGKPTSEYFTEKTDTAFLRVCRYTGGKSVLRETIVGKGRTPFTVNPNVISGEMFNVTFEPKLPIMPADGKYYFTKPSRLFKVKIKNLAHNDVRLFPFIHYFENPTQDDEVAYVGDCFTPERLDLPPLEIESGKERTLTDDEVDMYFGGFDKVHKIDAMWEVDNIMEPSEVEFDPSFINLARLFLMDYDKLLTLDLETDKKSSAILMNYDIQYNVSHDVKLGDVAIDIEPVVGFPTKGDVYIKDPGRLFKITLKNLTDGDLELIPGISYEEREIDEVAYSYIASKWLTKPSFVLKAGTTMELDRAFLKQFCGDETAVRHNHSTGENEENFTDFDEIITIEDANKMKFTLVDAKKLAEIPEDAENRSELITVSTQACEFWADPNLQLYDLNVYIEFKKNTMPCNPRAYLTKPEQLFKVWLENTSDETIQMIPFITFNFNGDMDTTYLCGSYKDENIPALTIEPGPKQLMKDEYVHMLFSGNNFFKVIEKDGKIEERLDYNVFNIDRDVTLDPELFSQVQFLALNPDFLGATEGTLEEFIVGSGECKFQVSPTERLDDVSVIIKPKSDPLPSNADLYFNSPGVLFDVELKNNTLEPQNVILSTMYLFDEFGSYYGSVYDDSRLEEYITLGVGEIKPVTSEMLNRMCGTPKEVKCFEARVNGFVETPIEDIDSIVNLEAFNQVEIIAYCADSLKKLPKEMEDRKNRAFLGGGKSDFNAKNIPFEDVVVTIAPKGGADYRLEPDTYFEKPGDLFKVTIRNLTTEEKKVNLRLTFNDKYFIDKPDSLIVLGPEDNLELTAERLNNICGYDIYSYGAPLFECDENGVIKSEKPSASELEMKKGDNKVTALVWRKKIADEENPNVYSVDSVSVCDTIYQPALRKLWIGDYRLTLTEFEKIEGKDAKMKEEGNDCFKGKGYVSDTIMGIPMRIAVEYDSIYVNNKLQRVVKNNVRSIIEESSHAPIDIFKEEIVKQLGESDKETAEAKVDELLDKSGMGAFYTYVIGNAMQTIGKVDSLSMVKLPLGLTVPMDKDMKCPATIQLAQKEYTPVDANIDLLGEFVMPESEYLDSEILIFAARKLTSSPDEFLPKTGSLGLVKDFTVKDPNSDFLFTFKAPTNQDYSKATDGCYIMWKDGDFAELCASISMNLPFDELMKDDGVKPVEKGVHPNITLTAFIADKEDWYGTVKMDDFQSTRAPGFTFSVTGAETGIVLDRSKKKTPDGIKFPENYKYDDPLGLSADPGKDETAYNEWQGFYFQKLGCKLPPFVELDDDGKSRAEISVNNMIYDDSGFSMNVSVDSLLNKGTAKMGGWNITIDRIWLNIKQNHFGDAGMNGRIEVPLLYAKTSGDNKDEKGDDEGGEEKDSGTGEKKKAQIGYSAKIANAVKDDKEGIEVDFSMQQIEDEIAFDFMLAEVSFNKEKTYFNVKYSDLYPEDKRTRVELRLDGEVAIKCSEGIDFELPTIPFEDMRFANFEDEKKKNDKSPESKDQKESEGQSLTSPDGDVDFHTGKWALSGDPDDGGDFWGGFPLVLDGISMKVGEGAKSLGVYVNGGIVVMGNAKTGLGATVGLTIWSDVDWDKMDISYREVEFNDMHVEGSFGGMVSINGDLTVKNELKGSNEEENSEGGEQKQEEGGEDPDAGKMKGFDAKLTIKVKGLFETSISGGYYKVKKGSADYELDDADEKKNEYYHAGYFLADAKIPPVPIGPVSLNGITGGIFINYAVAVSELEEADDFVQAMHDNLKPKYKSYGGAFGVSLVVGEETLVKGDAVMLLMIDMQSDGTVRCPGFMFQGNIAALCAPDSDEGLINSRITILYEDTTTPELTEEEKLAKTPEELKADAENRKEEHKLFRLSITMDADIAGMYKNITGEEYQVVNPMVGLEEFDQKKADAENQGEQNNTSSSAGSAESKGYIKAGAGASMALELEIRNYPSTGKTFWHLYVGEPDESKRCRITFIDFEFGRDKPVGLWAKLYANAYLCLGNELPGNGELPPLPEKVVEALGMKGADGKVDNSLKGKIEAARQQTMKGGPAGDINGGIMMGAAIGAEFGCNAVFCYANVEGMLGFDLILKQYADGVKCTDGRRAGGKNGFYATGQVYAMLKGELGLMLNLWIFEGKVPLVDMTLGALLQGGFPNPTWVYGRLRAKGSVLGGLIKFNSTIEMKAGKICVPEMGNPLDDIKVFGDIKPGDEDIEIGWADKSLVSCYGEATFTTNMKIGKTLTLVDEGETMERAGMDGDGNNVLRSYIFYLDKQFELCKYDESDNTDDERSHFTSYVTHVNPTFDQENFQIKLGSLQPRTLYRIKLRGTCKEIVNGDEVDPIYKDTVTGKKVHRPFADTRYVYFRTDNLSDNINDEVAGYLPNKTPFTKTIDEVTQPSFMEKHIRNDYWTNPDHEFEASIKVYNSSTGQYVFPDARDGLRKGQESKYDKLQVVEIVENGIDDNNNPFTFATVTLKDPVPKEHIRVGDKLRFEIRRVNRAQLDSYMNLIEENYRSIMALTEDDIENYEKQLEEMDAVIADGDSKAGDKSTNQAIRDLYKYYKEINEQYGENEAEQRMKEYKEELKANTSAFAEVVYTHDYDYPTAVSSFLDYVKMSDNWKYTGNDATVMNTSSVYCQIVDIVTNEEAKMSAGNDPNAVYTIRPTENRSNNPYFALNYWNSVAAVWKAPKYDFCSRPFDECNFTGARAVSYYSWLYPFMRNGLVEGKTYSDWQYEVAMSPKFLRNWFAFDDVTTYTKVTGKKRLFKVIWYAIQSDAELANSFESYLQRYYKNYFKTYIEKNDKKNVKIINDIIVENGTMCYGSGDFINDEGFYIVGTQARIPAWQIPLMYAADHPNMYGLNAGNSRSATSSYRYFTGQWSIFQPSNYLDRIKTIKVRVRFNDGYNIAEASGGGSVAPTTFGVRPSTSARRTALLTCDINGKGVSGVTDRNISFEREEYVIVADTVMREYLLENYDSDDDGRLHLNEMARITKLVLDFSKIYYEVKMTYRPGMQRKYRYIESLDALRQMPNLIELELKNNMLGDMPAEHYNRFHGKNKTLRFDDNPKLKKLTLDRWYVDTLDLRYNAALTHLLADMRDPYNRLARVTSVKSTEGIKYLDVSKCTELTSLKVMDCFLETLDLSNITKLDVIDLRMNCLSSLDISASYKLTDNFVAVGFQVYNNRYNNAAGRVIGNYIKNVSVTSYNVAPTGTTYDTTSPNYKVKFTKRSEKDAKSTSLDDKLYGYMYDEAQKAKKSVFDWAKDQTTLRVEGLGIKSLKGLDAWMPKLKNLYVNDNELTELDLTGFHEMKSVYANNNKISSLSVSSENKMYWLEVNGNSLVSLPVSDMPQLSHLKCSNNNIDILYLNDNVKLNYLDCSSNYLTELVLDKLTELTTLICSYNQFAKSDFVLPANANFNTFKAVNCFVDVDELNLQNSTALRYIDVSNNKSLQNLRLPASVPNLKELVANDCNLRKVFCGGNNFHLFDHDAKYKPKTTMSNLELVNVANNPGMIVAVCYNRANYGRLKAIDVSGCDVYKVFLFGTNVNTLTRLCVGIPQKSSGNKVDVQVFDKAWFRRWDEWKDWPENRHTTMMRLYKEPYPYTLVESYDPVGSTTLERITEDDKKLRAAMGETFYKYMKDKLSPDSLGYRALHVENVKDLTELQCANMEIVDLEGILKYMPKAAVVNAAGNNMKSVILKSLNGVDELDLSNNPSLDSLSFNNQSKKIAVLNLSHSYVNEYGLINAMKVANKGKVFADGEVGPQLLNVARSKTYSYPGELSLVSNGRSFVIYNLETDKLTIGGKSVKFFVGMSGSYKVVNEIDRLYLADSSEPIELIFNSADMALLWLNKWIDDNPGRKFTMKIETGNASKDNTLNSLLAVVNNITKNGIAKLDDKMRETANNVILKYAWDGTVSKGYKFTDILDEYDLHEKMTADDIAMKNAMGVTLYSKLHGEYAAKREYLHVEDLKNVTTLNCENCGLSNLENVLKYMPAVTTVKASGNYFRSVVLGAKGRLTSVDLSNGKATLESITFNNSVGSLDLSNTTINSSVLAAAVKNTTTALTLNGSIGITPSINEKLQSVKDLKTNCQTLRISSSKLQTLEFSGTNLYLNNDLSYISISNLRLKGTGVHNIYVYTADVALKIIAEWAMNNTQTAGSAPKFSINFYNSSQATNMMSTFNSMARNGNGFTTQAKKVAAQVIINAVNSRYISKGANYEAMLNLLNEQGLADVQSADDKELKNALGSTMYNSLKNKYAKSKNYLHVSDVLNLTTLDAERCDVVDIATVLKYMPKLSTIYLRYNDIKDIDLSAHKGIISTFDISDNTALRTFVARSASIRNIDLSYSYVNSTILKNALSASINGVTVNGNGGVQFVTLDNVSANNLVMQSTNRILQLNSCTLNKLTFGGQELIFAGDLSKCKIKDFDINRPSGSVNVEFHSADAALMWIEYWCKKAPTTAFTIELIGSNTNNSNKIKSRLTSINNTLRRGKMIDATTRTQLYDEIKLAVSSYGLKPGAMYGNYVTVVGQSGNKTVTIQKVTNKINVIKVLQDVLGIGLVEAKNKYVDVLPSVVGKFSAAEAATIKSRLETAGAVVTVQ